MAKLPKKPINPVHEFFPAGDHGAHTPLHRLSDEDLAALRKEPGKSNAYKYDVASSDYAGPDHTFPINTEKRGESAIKLAHNAADPSAIKAKVYKKYPDLKPEIGVQSPNNNSKTA